MGSEADDLQVNPLFQAFMSSEYFSVAAKQKLIVCVPAAASLKLVKMNKEFLQYHVIKVSPFSDEEYVTQNGKGVILKEGKVSAGKGFPRPRTVTVVFEELYYDEAFESFRLLRINFPLIGKIPLDYYKAVTVAASGSGAVPIEKRTLVQHRDVIERILGPCTSTISEHPNAFAPSFDVLIAPLPPSPAVWSPITPADMIATSCQRFVQSFNNSYVMVKGFIAHTGTKVREACLAVRDEALAKAKTLPNKPPVTTYQASELQAALEQCVMAAIHKKVWNGLCELYATEDRNTQLLLDDLQNLPMTALGVRPEIVCSPMKAIRRLAQINLCGTPFDKLNCLSEVNLLLTEAVDDAARAAFEEAEKRDGGDAKKRGDQVLTTDDVLPLTTYVLIRARVPNLQANLEYLSHFKCVAPDLNLSHLSVHLANFTGALEYINSGKLNPSSSSGTPSRKPRTDSVDDYPGSPLSPSPPTSSHGPRSSPPDLDLRSSSSSSSSASRGSGSGTSGTRSIAAAAAGGASSLSASELSSSDRDIGYDAYGRGPVPTTLPQAAPRPSSSTSHSRHSSFDRESKSTSSSSSNHHHRDSSTSSNGFVPPPSSKRPGRNRPSRGPARDSRDRDEELSASMMTGLRVMDDDGPAKNIRPLNFNLSDDDDSDSEPVVTSTRSISSASSSSSSVRAPSSYSGGSTSRSVSAAATPVTSSTPSAAKRSTLAERSASRSSLLNRAPAEEDFATAKASLLAGGRSAAAAPPSRSTPPSSSNGRSVASSSSSSSSSSRYAPSAASAKKEADLGDFLSRLRSSGDVTGKLTDLSRNPSSGSSGSSGGGAGTRRT